MIDISKIESIKSIATIAEGTMKPVTIFKFVVDGRVEELSLNILEDKYKEMIDRYFISEDEHKGDFQVFLRNDKIKRALEN